MVSPTHETPLLGNHSTEVAVDASLLALLGLGEESNASRCSLLYDVLEAKLVKP